MGFLISAVLAAASTTCCVVMAALTRGHTQEFTGFLAIVAFIATLAFSIGAAGQPRPNPRSRMSWAKLITESVAFVVCLPVTALVGGVVFITAFPLVLMMLFTEWPTQPEERRHAFA